LIEQNYLKAIFSNISTNSEIKMEAKNVTNLCKYTNLKSIVIF